MNPPGEPTIDRPGSSSQTRFPFTGSPPPGIDLAAADRQQTVISAPRASREGSSNSTTTIRAPGSQPELVVPSPTSMKLFPGQRIEPQADQVTGETLGHFVIKHRIGAGGMGTVFLADDEKLQRQVALKVLSPEQTADPASVQRFQNEARSAARLDHDHVARVFFYGDDQGLHYIAYEYVQGSNLRDLIRARGRLDPAEVVAYAVQLASALCHTSASGVVHRDIKPSNIIITLQGKAKLVDLGLARKESLEESAQLTVAGTTLGTFDYISPEQAKDPRNVDVRSDIYSLGCTLYHALTGEPPFPEGTVLQRLLDHQDKEPPDPALKNRRISPALSAVVRKMMAPDPRRRYLSAEALLHDLMVIGGALGLRALPEGSAALDQLLAGRRGGWTQNLPWLATAALLVLAAAVWQAFPVDGDGIAATGDLPGPAATRAPSIPEVPSPSREPTEGLAARDVRPLPTFSGVVNGSQALTPTPRPSEGGSSSAGASPNGTVAAPPVAASPPPLDDPAMAAARANDVDQALNRLFPTPVAENALPGVELPFTLRTQIPELLGADPAAPRVGTPNPSRETTTVAVIPRLPETASPSATGDRRVTVEPGEPKPLPAATKPFLIAGQTTGFDSLDDAFAAIRDQGVIELHFDGPRADPERPLRIVGKRVTLQAARGRQPMLRFAPAEAITDPAQSRMITVVGGALTVQGVALEFQVRPGSNVDRWALFRLERAEWLRLERTHVTMRNPSHAAAAVFESAAPSSAFAAMGAMPEGGPKAPMEIACEQSVIRGETNGLWLTDSAPIRGRFRQSLITIGEWLVLGEPATDMMAASMRVGLDLEHVTCLLGQGFLQTRGGADGGERSAPLEIAARNNVFSCGYGAAFLEQQLAMESMEFRRAVTWSGDGNRFDGIETFWLAKFHTPPVEERWDFDAWRNYWKSADLSGIHNQPVTWLRSARQQPWSSQSIAALRAEAQSAALSEAVTPGLGTSAGVGWDQLPPEPLSPR